MRIGIIGAMDEEVALLKNKMADGMESEVANSHFYSGKLEGTDAILVKSNIGKVNAALATALLIDRYHPEIIINTGSAGGFDTSLNIGDVVISTDIRHHDVDVTAFNYEYGQVPDMPPSFVPDPYLVEIAEKAAQKNDAEVQIVKGLIATGDSFMSDPDRVRSVKEKFPDLKAAEMEAAAIAQVCYQFGVPFVIIRSLSDIAGKDADRSFDQFLETAAKHSASLIISMIKELKKDAQKDERGKL